MDASRFRLGRSARRRRKQDASDAANAVDVPHGGAIPSEVLKSAQPSLLVRLAPLLLLLTMALLLVTTAWRVDRTSDEHKWLRTSRDLMAGKPLETVWHVKQPILIYAVEGVVNRIVKPSRAVELRVARMAVIPFALLLAWIAYVWAKRLFGRGPALVTLALCATDPNVLAHGSLFTTDVVFAAFFVLSFFALDSWVEKPTLARAVLLCGATALSALAKYSGILVLPFEALVGVALVFLPGRRSRGASPRAFAGVWIAAVVCALLLLNAAYGFKGSFRTFGSYDFRSSSLHALASKPLLRALPVPLPETYVLGLDVQKAVLDDGFPAVFLGERSTTGFTWFYPLAWLMKTPVAALALVLAGLVIALRRARSSAREIAAVVLPAALLIAYVWFGNRNSAVFRYVIGALPFGYVLAASVATAAPRWLVGFAVLTTGVESVWIAPDFIAFCNVAVGGPKQGYRYFTDSNFDWSQADVRAETFLRERRKAGDPWIPAGCNPNIGRLLVRTNDYQDLLATPHCRRWLRRFEPSQRIGFVWLQFELNLENFRDVAHATSASCGARAEWVDALVASGRLEEADREARATVAAFPSEPEAHVAVGRALLAAGRATEALVPFREARRLAGGRLGAPDHIPPSDLFLHAIASAEAGDEAEARLVGREARVVKTLENQRAAIILEDGRDLRVLPIDQWERAITEEIQHRGRTAVLENDLGVARWARGDVEGARAALEETLQLDPLLLKTRINLGVVLEEMGQFERALGIAQEVARTAESLNVRTKFHFPLGQSRLGLTDFLSIYPVGARLSTGWPRHLTRSQELSLAPPSPERDLDMAREALQSGSVATAWLGASAITVTADPRVHAGALTLRAQILWRLRLPDRAEALVREAVSIDSTAADATQLLQAMTKEQRRTEPYVR